MTKGIDISYAQNNVDFAKVKVDGFDFVIIRDRKSTRLNSSH